MKSLGLVLPFIALTFCCWGVYGPTLHHGQAIMGDYHLTDQLSTLRPLICVGIAYFLIAVIYPAVVLFTKGEKGHWTFNGTVWSFLAGIAGAFGALGITLAFKFRGDPVYVMPLVFGCAPVVNTLVAGLMSRTLKEASSIFYLGIIVVAIGAAGVLLFKPSHKAVDAAAVIELYQTWEVDRSPEGEIRIAATMKDGEKREQTFATLKELKEDEDYYNVYRVNSQKARQPTLGHVLMIIFSIALTALCWGTYGSVLHKGQMKMGGSRLRPFMCVGLAYFAVAVVVPILLLNAFEEPGGLRVKGIFWSLLGGAAGALGAMGIIYAFNFGGKPIFVMPLVFGFAPVVNTFVTMTAERTLTQIPPLFLLCLALVISGAVTVLVFAPRPKPVPVPIGSKVAKSDVPTKKSKVDDNESLGDSKEDSSSDDS